MRKQLFLLTAFIVFISTSSCYATFTKSGTEATVTSHTLLAADQKAVMESFALLSRKEYEQLTGKHLHWRERLTFTFLQATARRQLKKESPTKGFHALGFFLPLLLGIVGLPLGLLVGLGFLVSILFSLTGAAVISASSKDKNMHKWAWIGFGTYVVGLAALIFIIITTIDFG